jgi:hypothetical protein
MLALLLALAAAGCRDVGTDPTPPSEPVQLVEGTTVGRSFFPIGNSAQGGQGQPIGGVSCIQDNQIAYHIHPHLSLFMNGEQIAIPLGLGITPVREQGGFAAPVTGITPCVYWIHTHDATGLLHVEPPTDALLTLGQVFDVWGQPLSRSNVAGFSGNVTAFVNGQRYNDDLRALRLEPRMQINLQVGSPVVAPPTYLFPPGY